MTHLRKALVSRSKSAIHEYVVHHSAPAEEEGEDGRTERLLPAQIVEELDREVRGDLLADEAKVDDVPE